MSEVHSQLQGAIVPIRHSYSENDGDQSRSQVLPLFPEGSPGYNEVFRRSDDVESMHRHPKDLMFNDRVATVGDRNMRIWTDVVGCPSGPVPFPIECFGHLRPFRKRNWNTPRSRSSVDRATVS
jgi:hypothetical protein